MQDSGGDLFYLIEITVRNSENNLTVGKEYTQLVTIIRVEIVHWYILGLTISHQLNTKAPHVSSRQAVYALARILIATGY